MFNSNPDLPIASDRLNQSENRSVHPPCLRYRSPLNVRSEQIGMENRSNFIPTPEFHKSEIGIPIERNFPAGPPFLACLMYLWNLHFSIVSEARNAEVIFVEKPQIRTLSFQNEIMDILCNTWSDKALKGGVSEYNLFLF